MWTATSFGFLRLFGLPCSKSYCFHPFVSLMEEGSSQDSDETDETDPDVPVETEPKWGSDFALGRVPRSMRYSWVSMAMEQVAQGGCIAVVVIGAQLGHKMTERNAILAVIIGNLILAVASHLPLIWFVVAVVLKG